jgi:HTH-type transcriptional regulator, transcriptional repressor of NAD biosynthesis genes
MTPDPLRPRGARRSRGDRRFRFASRNVRAMDVLRVCLLGAESTGKTTLARLLAAAYETVWNPEYGRPYTEIGRPDGALWTSWEFTHIARIQCWYEDFLADLANRVLFCDTDAQTTAVFHETYLGTAATDFAAEAARLYDLYVVCGIDVPWERDAIREFATERRRMHEVYLAYAEATGRPWLHATGGRDERLSAVGTAVDRLLAARARPAT